MIADIMVLLKQKILLQKHCGINVTINKGGIVEMRELNVLKVAGKSSVPSVAGSIVKSIEDGRDVELHAIGASAVNQTCKAIATARGILATKGIEALSRLGFSTTEINGEERTMIIFKIILS
jgi:stage V sporulation protein SpoVS